MNASAWIPQHLRDNPLPTSQTILLTSVIPHLLDAISEISKSLRQAHHVSRVGTANAFGDEQLNVDVSAEKAIRAALAKCPCVVTASSEEDPVERPVVHHEPEPALLSSSSTAQDTFTAAFDPLDGSSIIDSNWTVGTIIGIWKGETALGQSPREKQIAAVLGVYGPRTTAIIALREPPSQAQSGASCFEVALGQDGEANPNLIRPFITFSPPPFKTRYFAPANLRAASEDEWYAGLISHYIASRYTLRYSGGLVPDVCHALVKGHGLYISPVPVRAGAGAKAKLRRLYELCPVALVVECAGGRAVEDAGGNRDILEREIGGCDERGGIICGNREEVEEIIASVVNRDT